MATLLLASNSPRRQQILRDAGYDFTVQVKDTNEDFDAALKREQIPLYLARKKAEAFAAESESNVVITADTIVWINERVLNKPQNEAEAREMLRMLSGNKHEVYTAVCILHNKKYDCFYDVAEVYFKELSDEEINYYVEKYKPLDKAGAYGVQEWIGMIGIEKFVGSFYTVMGLPVNMVYERLKKMM